MPRSCLLKKTFILLFLAHALNAEVFQGDLRIAGFIPQKKLFRDLYGTILPSYQIEGAWDIYDHLKIWANISYSDKHGRSEPLNIKSKLQLAPLSAGLKYLYYLKHEIDIYAGAGICYAWLKEKNDLTFSNTFSNVGGIIKTGMTKHYKWATFSFFADYLIQRFNITTTNCTGKASTNGLLLGAGIGMYF